MFLPFLIEVDRLVYKFIDKDLRKCYSGGSEEKHHVHILTVFWGKDMEGNTSISKQILHE